MAMKINIDIPSPSGGWWKVLAPLSPVALIVFAVGASHQTDWSFLIFSLASEALVLGFIWLREVAVASRRDNAAAGTVPSSVRSALNSDEERNLLASDERSPRR